MVPISHTGLLSAIMLPTSRDAFCHEFIDITDNVNQFLLISAAINIYLQTFEPNYSELALFGRIH